jgi:hypothetical protein
MAEKLPRGHQYREIMPGNNGCQCRRPGSDIYELFSLAETTPNAPFLLVRARHDR